MFLLSKSREMTPASPKNSESHVVRLQAEVTKKNNHKKMYFFYADLVRRIFPLLKNVLIKF